jgi:hypothetical protein
MSYRKCLSKITVVRMTWEADGSLTVAENEKLVVSFRCLEGTGFVDVHLFEI